MGAPRYTDQQQGDENRGAMDTSLERFQNSHMVEGKLVKKTREIFNACAKMVSEAMKRGESFSPEKIEAYWWPFEDWIRACTTTISGDNAEWCGEPYPEQPFPFPYGGSEEDKRRFREQIVNRALASVSLPRGVSMPKI